MNTERRTARIVGIFFILATLAGITSASLSGPIYAPDYLVSISENESQVLLSALSSLIMAIAVAGIAITAFPVLRKQNEALALGYVGTRIAEGIMFILTVISWLLLLVLSREYTASVPAAAADYTVLGGVLLSVSSWVGHVILDVAISPLHYLIFYSLLFQSRLVPRWLSIWGLLGVPMWLTAGVLAMLGWEPTSTLLIILNIPIALNEMVLAVWLIVRGFNSTSDPDGQNEH